jgi:hypothetical protein
VEWTCGSEKSEQKQVQGDFKRFVEEQDLSTRDLKTQDFKERPSKQISLMKSQ